MPVTPSSNPIEAGRAIAEHAARLAKLELELKTVELRAKATRFGVAAGLGLLAILLAPLLVMFLLAAVAAALASLVPVWAAILIVAGILLSVVAALAAACAVMISGARGDKEGRADGAS